MLIKMQRFYKKEGAATIAAVVMGGAAVGSYVQGEKASKAAKQQAQAQREGQEAQQRSADVEAQRQRIAQVREARIRRAQVLASAGNTGLGEGGTSAIGGAVGSISTQMGANIGTINQTQTFAAEASAASTRAAEAASAGMVAQARGQQWQAIGALSGATFKDLGGWSKIFGENVKSV